MGYITELAKRTMPQKETQGKWRGQFTVEYPDGRFKNSLKSTTYGCEWSFIKGAPPYEGKAQEVSTGSDSRYVSYSSTLHSMCRLQGL